MSTWNSSHTVTIELGPTFGVDTTRVRNGQINCVNDIVGSDDLIFSLTIPLELDGVAANASSERNTLGPSALTFRPSGEGTVDGVVTPDVYIREILGVCGTTGMSVDSLSRSILLTDIDEHTFIASIRSHTDIDAESLTALKRALLVPTFYDMFDDETAAQATALLKANIRRHEQAHVRCLITPETALWRELELYWRSILLGANQRTWNDPSFLTRFASLFTTPSRFTNELLAMAQEDYTRAEPRVQRAVETRVSEQRGTESVLLQFIEDHDIDRTTLVEMLRSPVGEQYCDLWLAYVLSELRNGRSPDAINAEGFHTTCAPTTMPHDEIVDDAETRALFVDFIRERLLGPVCEIVRLTLGDDTFALNRAWYSLNPGVSAAESLLAIRRVLYRRQFLSTFGTNSGLAAIRAKREAGVERIIHGAARADVPLYDVSLPSPDDIAQCLPTASETAAAALLGPTATAEELRMWLNDPDYGFTETTTG